VQCRHSKLRPTSSSGWAKGVVIVPPPHRTLHTKGFIDHPFREEASVKPYADLLELTGFAVRVAPSVARMEWCGGIASIVATQQKVLVVREREGLVRASAASMETLHLRVLRQQHCTTIMAPSPKQATMLRLHTHKWTPPRDHMLTLSPMQTEYADVSTHTGRCLPPSEPFHPVRLSVPQKFVFPVFKTEVWQGGRGVSAWIRRCSASSFQRKVAITWWQPKPSLVCNQGRSERDKQRKCRVLDCTQSTLVSLDQIQQ
jgi:hypothetical protein